jgi:hypothetical protein
MRVKVTIAWCAIAAAMLMRPRDGRSRAHTSETLPAHDAAACGSVVVQRCDEHVAERLMVSLDVIVSGAFSDELAQVERSANALRLAEYF